jgi:hypothetical protein
LILADFPANGVDMLTWKEFAEARPDLAEAGRELLYPVPVGLAFLGTVRKDGGPRMHPMCPVIANENLYAFIERGPKRYDLIRDGRYALHSFPPDKNEDAFYMTGRIRVVDDPDVQAMVSTAFWAERGKSEPPEQASDLFLVEFLIDRCLLTRTTGHGDWNPQHTIWKP